MAQELFQTGFAARRGTLTAEHLGGTLWRVTESFGANAPPGGEWTVSVRATDNTAAAAFAAVQEMLAPPPELEAAQAAASRSAAARAECRGRILAVVPETAQVNLTAAAAADLLPPADLAIFRAGLGWIAAMRAAWVPLAAGGGAIADDAAWPPVPAGVAALAARF